MSLTTVTNMSRFFTGVFDEQKITMSGRSFSGFFGRPGIGNQIITNHYRFDDNVIRSDNKIAKLIPRTGNFSQHLGSLIKTLRTGDYTKFSRDFPLCVEHFSISKRDLQEMAPMESNPYSGEDIEQRRMMYHSNRAIREIRRRTEDLLNILASQSLIDGTQDKIIGTTIDEEKYTWNRAAANFITVATVWTNTSADVIGDLVKGARQLHQQGKVSQNTPLIVGLSGPTMEAVKQNLRVLQEADNMRYFTVNANPELQVPASHAFMLDNGWTFHLQIKSEGWTFYLYATEDFYEEDNGTKTRIMPDDKAIITSPFVKMDSIFGPGEFFDLGPEHIRMFQSWFGWDLRNPPPGSSTSNGRFQIIPNNAYHIIGAIDKWNTVREFAVQIAPVFKPVQTDGIVTLEGLS